MPLECTTQKECCNIGEFLVYDIFLMQNLWSDWGQI